MLIDVGGNKGTGEKDILNGGAGADFYVLGSRKQAFNVGNGDVDFASVIGLDVTKDTLRLHGGAGDYTFGMSGSAMTVSLKAISLRKLARLVM